MKILVIHGSMRRGNTYKLAQEVIASLREKKDVQIDEIEVKKLELPFCASCLTCFSKGENKCPHAETVQDVANRIKQSDGIILTGVVYSLHLNAAMKNLIDHLSYFFHRPCLFDKKGMAITTTAGAGENKVAKYLQSVMSSWGMSGILRLSEKIQTEPCVLTEKQKQRAKSSADKFYDLIEGDINTPPSFMVVCTYNAFRAMSLANNAYSKTDKEYWQSCGFGDKVYPRKISIVKKFVGHMTYAALKSFMEKSK